MSEKLVDCLDQISPLLDDTVKLMKSMQLNPSEYIALSFLTCADFSMRSALSLPTKDEELTEEQRENILELLMKKKCEADEVMRAASERFVNGWKVN